MRRLLTPNAPRSGSRRGSRPRLAFGAVGCLLAAFLLTLALAGTAVADEPEAPTITSAESTTFTEGIEGSFTVTATGNPSPTITETGTLPGGVTFNEGVLSGTPTQDGVYTISFQASNGVSPEAAQTFTLTVDASPTITSPESATFIEGTTNSFTPTATGFPSPTITETGTLPGGVTFSGGVLSGDPTVTGVFPITFTATNSAGFSTQGFTLTVDSTPTITSATHTTFTEGTAGSFTVTATGVPSPTITETGTLPKGVGLSGGVLSGAPTQGGVFPITLTATNSAGVVNQSFTLTVDAPPVFTSATKTTFYQGVAGSFTVTVSGTPTPTISEWGNLPPGVTATNGLLSGTPTLQGTYELTFIASNGIGSQTIQEFTLVVIGLRVTTTSLPEATRGVAYSQQLAAAGGLTPYKWKIVGGGLPAGLKLSAAGLISGTVKSTGNSSIVKVEVSDASKTDPQTALAEYTIKVAV